MRFPEPRWDRIEFYLDERWEIRRQNDGGFMAFQPELRYPGDGHRMYYHSAYLVEGWLTTFSDEYLKLLLLHRPALAGMIANTLKVRSRYA